jgi:hypothetical protein
MASLAAPALAAGIAGTALAHDGGSMGISLSAERLPPGGPLEIIGSDFAPGETLQIRLVGPSAQWSLPDVTAGVDGHFAVVLSVPPDATAGVYTLDAISRSGIIQRETFQVDAAAPGPALTLTPLETTGQHETVDVGGGEWLAVSLVAVGFVVVLFVTMAIRRHPSR